MMTNDFNEEPGSFWQIFYNTRVEIPTDPKTDQHYLDSQTREQVSTFDPPKGLSPDEYSQLFVNHFLKARQKTREVMEKGNYKLVRYSMLVQVGNEECYNDLDKIESSPDFHSWENPVMIEFFRNTRSR